jgi:hypothetical protein
MNPEELSEQAEHAHHAGQKGIGLTTAITAVLLAIATLLSHRAHTEEIKLQTKVNDQWGFYQAKHQRAHQYGMDAEVESAAGNHDLAIEFLKISVDEECGSPVEAGCQAPRVKQTPILQKLMAELKAPAGNSNSSANGTAEEATGSKDSGANDTRPKEPEAKAGESTKPGATAEHEKPVKEGVVREGAIKVQEKAREMERETDVISRRADHYDSAELSLEVSIVLCSIALLAENKLYWKLSFVSTVIGIAIATYGWLLT